MATEIPTLKATNREQLGSRYAKRLRTAGKLPAVLYGHGTAPMSLTLDAKETIHSLKHGAHVVKLAIEGGATENCLVKDLQFGWMGDDVIHLDLARVDLDEVVTVKVRLQFIGQPESAKKPGAVLTHDVTELEIEVGVPLLSKIPVVNRFFTNRVNSKNEVNLLLLIRPEIMIQRESEDLLFPGLKNTSDAPGGVLKE